MRGRERERERVREQYLVVRRQVVQFLIDIVSTYATFRSVMCFGVAAPGLVGSMSGHFSFATVSSYGEPFGSTCGSDRGPKNGKKKFPGTKFFLCVIVKRLCRMKV